MLMSAHIMDEEGNISLEKLETMKRQLAITKQLATAVLKMSKSENHSPCCSGGLLESGRAVSESRRTNHG